MTGRTKIFIGEYVAFDFFRRDSYHIFFARAALPRAHIRAIKTVNDRRSKSQFSPLLAMLIVICPLVVPTIAIALSMVVVVTERRSLIFKSSFNHHIPERLVSYTP